VVAEAACKRRTLWIEHDPNSLLICCWSAENMIASAFGKLEIWDRFVPTTGVCHRKLSRPSVAYV